MVRGGWDAISRNDERMIEYIRDHSEIRDVIVSGGDPLTLPAVTLRLFFENGFKNLMFSDFLPPTLKTMCFGLIIGVISCFQGMRTRGGTEGVGRAATSSVVLSSLFVILADVVLVRLIQVVYG